ncbi:MAG: MaoC family dehydratase [Firmicutes bacterium]|nr:MaoC family dehydratase [Bacillota bacterium]
MRHIAKHKRPGKMIDEIRAGDTATVSHLITEREVYMYMGLTNDLNPIYVDRDYASRTQFKEPIVPVMLVAGHIGAAITARLPGPGTITVSQRFSFEQPVKYGDTITTELEVIEVKAKEHRVRLRTVTRNQHATVVVTGECEVIAPPKLTSVLNLAFEDYE